MNCDEERTVENAIFLTKMNEQRAEHSHPLLSETDLTEALTTLECLRNDHTRWWLREWIRVKYRWTGRSDLRHNRN